MNIEFRSQRLVNTDPQRRCYNRCNFKEELQWSEWEVLEMGVTRDKIEARLRFWRELKDSAISARGEGARQEFRWLA